VTDNRDPIPVDDFDRALVANVCPTDWINPQPDGRYNLVVIGAGTAGLITAIGAAGLGAKVALVERHRMGGDCLNVGCVPSKALLRSARAIADVRHAQRFGVDGTSAAKADFAAVMQRMRRLRAGISQSDAAARYRDAGVDVYFGDARFNGSDTVQVSGRAGSCALQFRRAVIATGSRPANPAIPGLAEAGYLTNETVFELAELPRRMAVIGGGPLGCELAQAFARFGTEVVQFESHERILIRDEADTATLVARSLERDGVHLFTGSRIVAVSRREQEKIVAYERGGRKDEIAVDQILVAAGRVPNVDGLNLEGVDVRYDPRGVRVDERLRTTNSKVYACGDVCSDYKFTHVADFLARIVIQNALFFGRARASALTIPWCTYTDPEVAHVGLSKRDAAERGVAIDTFRQELADVDRARLDGEEEGFVEVHVRKGTDRIVGATIVASHAGEMISELTLAMVGKVGLKTIAKTIHPYPTQAEAIRKLGDQYNRARLTPLVRRAFRTFLAWRR